jgi:DNA primase
MDQIAEIKQKIDVVDLISTYVPLTKSGRNYKGLCPFHSEKTPSFMVSPELQMFKCFGCGQGGDVFKFIELVEGIDFPQALRQLADKAGVKLEQNISDKEEGRKKILYEINHLAAVFYHFILIKHPAGKKALEYFIKKRKIKKETIEQFNLGYAPESWDILYRSFSKKGYKTEDLLNAGLIVKSTGSGHIDKFRARVMFPLADVSGKIVGFSGRVLDDTAPKYLNTPETQIFHKGSFIFALDKAKLDIKKEGAIVVEGHTDCITAHQYGINNVVASGGTAFTTSQLQILKRYTEDLILCFDADTAGDAAIQRGIELAEKENFNIKVIVVPAPYKDLDELLNADLASAKELISNPIPIYDFYLVSAFKHNDKTTALGK